MDLYRDLDENGRRLIRNKLIIEQKSLCAYCCCRITINSSRNSHLKSQRDYPNKSLEWGNLVASCDYSRHCDKFQRVRSIPLTPLMESCEEDLVFTIAGRVEGKTDEAKETIKILNLNEKSLVSMRKKAILEFFDANQIQPIDEYYLLDDEILEICIALSTEEDQDGNLIPFAPIFSRIMSDLLASRKPL